MIWYVFSLNLSWFSFVGPVCPTPFVPTPFVCATPTPSPSSGIQAICNCYDLMSFCSTWVGYVSWVQFVRHLFVQYPLHLHRLFVCLTSLCIDIVVYAEKMMLLTSDRVWEWESGSMSCTAKSYLSTIHPTKNQPPTCSWLEQWLDLMFSLCCKDFLAVYLAFYSSLYVILGLTLVFSILGASVSDQDGNDDNSWIIPIATLLPIVAILIGVIVLLMFRLQQKPASVGGIDPVVPTLTDHEDLHSGSGKL